MFVISQSETYHWPVTVEVPVDGGKHERQAFDGLFKRLPQKRIEEIKQQADAGTLSDVDLAREILVGWKGINDAGGADVPYTEVMRDTVLDIPGVATAIVFAYIGSLTGAKRKN